MEAPHNPPPGSNLTAAPGDPHFGVHVLTEFLYCPRAGIVAYESQPDDDGEDERPGRLDYLPRYDLANIEAVLMRSLHSLFWLSLLLLLTVVASLVLSVTFHPRIKWAGIPIFLLLLIPTVGQFVNAVRLVARRAAALSASAREPLFDNSDQPQEIDWWQLRNAGFTAKRYEETLVDRQDKLSGRPYLVLCRGDLRVPVFRRHRPTERLHAQHFARIAAYCHLIERGTGFQSPYGVILFGTTYQGLAVRNAPATRRALRVGLTAARRIVRDSRRGVEPLPPHESLCRHCPVGRPIAHQPGVTETVSTGGVLPVRGVFGPHNHLYHSRCGDRFRWLPPHERVVQLSLQPRNH